jgi:hypothetical protein
MTDQRPPESRPEIAAKLSFAMICLRYVLPAVVVIGGVVVMLLGSESDVEGGAGIAGAGLAIYAMNWLIRKASDDPERAQEEAARDYFDVHGRWPDEVGESGAAQTASPPPSASVPSASARSSQVQPVAPAQRRLERPAIPRSRGSHGR